MAMLSGVLRSKRAIQVNIAVMRAFVRLRSMIASNKEVRHSIQSRLRRHPGAYDTSKHSRSADWVSARRC
ncbi:hypothetical protein COMA2_70072 [Candidatus Nitrospira nitrificans]|uniref:KilA-N DNA-binding domain-containing protein n=1 Tax=Candidatus Nitrospira nitrificans TaxID=1742973 RepID=A0A0S4LRK5_9BACT|nr:hypothetical protein COMA2_70072 [Candidatus Nitrospira nitrificans]